MFDTVIIDLTTNPLSRLAYPDIDSREVKLFPFIYLIAERVYEAGYRREGLSGARPSFVTEVYTVNEGMPNVLHYALKGDGVLFSASAQLKAEALKGQGLTTQNAILVLAAAGLEITVPNITLDIARSEEIQEIKRKLIEERLEYLQAISTIADETFNRLMTGYYKDTVDWALNEAFMKIKPKAEKFNLSMKKLERNLLQRVAFNFFTEGIPSIGSIALEKGLREGATKAIEVLLEVLSKNLAKKIEERKIPEVVYGFKLSKNIERLAPNYNARSFGKQV